MTERAKLTDLAEEREVRLGWNCDCIDIVRTIDIEGRGDCIDTGEAGQAGEKLLMY